ncbi:seipin-like [Daphnia carinata]|uniref:seipin-like n=1 Tax=Daphnia carinata TaxID=120202 RepID=UPI00257B140E|nr:seipin-like [Daphnia carinata]
MANNLLSDVIDDYRKRALLAAFSFKDLVYRLFAFLLTTSFILWLSVFIYVTFYYSYVPAISHIRPVHLEFNSCQETVGICSNPFANVTLTNQRQLLQSNQPYNIIIDLELPESEANKELGMFMVQLTLTGKNGKFIAMSRRSAMLRYKSWILHFLGTVMFSPALLVGPMEEKQMLKVEMFSEFLEAPDNPVTNVRVEIESRWLQLYSVKLRIQAEFMGLRYFMFYWPTLSATIGISTHVVLLSFLVGYVWYRLLNPNQVVVRVGLNRATSSVALTTVPSQPTIATVEPQQSDDAQNKTLEQRRMEAREILMKEKKRQLTSPGVFTERVRSRSFSTVPAMARSPSFGSPLRIQELTPAPTPPMMEEKEDYSNEGLVMNAETSPELRRRIMTAAATKDPNIEDTC